MPRGASGFQPPTLVTTSPPGVATCRLNWALPSGRSAGVVRSRAVRKRALARR
jgi:hypothetical protein